MKLENLLIYYFSPVDWNHNWQRQHEFACALAQKNIVLFIEPIGFFNVGIGVLLKKIWEKIRLRSGATRKNAQPPENVHIVSLRFIPRHNNAFFERVNRWWMTRQLRRYGAQYGKGRSSVLWSGNPARTVFQLQKTLQPICVVYDNAMRFEKLPHVPSYVIEHEKEAVRASTFVITDNDFKLHEFLFLNPKSYKIPQGVDLSLFDASHTHEKPEELQHVKQPVVGYYGSLQSVFDYDLYEAALQALPEVQFVAIGPVRKKENLARLQRHKNFLHIPPQPHERLPQFLAHFDVCVIPYQVTPYTEGTFPTKLFEYLSFEKPVVAEPLAELRRFESVLYLAGKADEFIAALREALLHGAPNREKIAPLVRDNTWQSRYAAIEKIFMEQV